MGERPIANKYREGKMKSTLKRESKALEIVEREPIRSPTGPAMARNDASRGDSVSLCFCPGQTLWLLRFEWP